MGVKNLLGTPPPEKKARQKRDADDANDDRNGVGPDGPAGTRRLMGGDFGDGTTFVAKIIGGVVQSRLGDRPGLFGKLRQVVLRQVTRFERPGADCLGDATGVSFIDAFEPGH